MKNNRFYALLLSICLGGWLTMWAQNAKPFVIPELKEWKGGEGSFVPATDPAIVYRGHQAEVLEVAGSLANDYGALFGQSLKIENRAPKTGDFELVLKPNLKLGEEGYQIKIGKQVVVTAATPKGLYWATRTLLQMAEQHPEQQLPKGDIKDAPDYGIRGFMMDCGRKYIPLDYLQDLVKVMAYYKMNTLQIHLNDNGFKQYFEHNWDKTYAAFRLECDTYPGLTARDGSYSKKDFRNFQLESAKQFVEIIPEIDAPAHTLAFTQYKPEIGSKEYGMDHLDLFNPETYKFMDGLFKEYLEGDEPVFCSPKVHIGTDEYSNKDKKVVEKFREFTDRYIKLVESYGKQACVWGALTHAKGETQVKSENVIMSAWYNGYAEPKEMVKQGYQLISIPDKDLYIVPAAGYYQDYLNIEKLYHEWTPAHIGDVVFDEQDPAILGGMFAVWNDHVGNGITVKDIHHRLYPALQTLSAKMWTGQHVTVDFKKFAAQSAMLSEAPGVNQLARLSQKPGLVYEQSVLQPQTKLQLKEIGYDYTVAFDLEATDEAWGTALFRSPHAVFYLADPVSGSLGFARDGYLDSFGFSPYEGEKLHIEIVGTASATLLKVNGKTISELNQQTLWFNEGKDKMARVRTLVFPLQQTGQFKSRITNFKVYQN